MTRIEFIFLVFLACVIISCRKQEAITIPGYDTNETKVQFVDTFSVNLSTVLVDSLPTSSAERFVVGSMNLKGTGKVKSSGYFQISPLKIDSDNDDITDVAECSLPEYDSLVLILNHNYTYGDTTQAHTLKVYKLNQEISYNSQTSKLYNSSFFAYDQNPIGEKTVNFKNTNELRISLSDDVGEELFELLKNGDYRVTSSTNFKEYFKGLVLSSDVIAESIYGYDLNLSLRLYYHDNENSLVALYTDFTLKESDIYFNSIESDRASEKAGILKNIYQGIPSTMTDNEVYLLTGVELMPKIEFPSLNEFKINYPYSAVNKAELIIHPKKGTFNPLYFPPDRLLLYTTTSTNIPGSAISSSSTGNIQLVNPLLDWESYDQTYYKFDITDFVFSKLENSDEEAALLLASLQLESAGRIERLILGNNRDNLDVKLKVFITTFK